MSYSVEKKPNISYEPPDKRNFYRFINPLTVIINKREYKTVDWSVDAFKITGYEGNLAEKETTHADMDINFQGVRFILSREVEILRLDKENSTLVARYTDENPRNHSALVSLCNRLATGEYQSVNDVINHIDIPITDNYLKQTFQGGDEVKTPESRRYPFIWAFIATGILVAYVILSGIINSYFFLKTDFAAISGGTEVLTAPANGVIADIFVKEGEFAKKGRALFRTINPKTEQQTLFKRNEILKNEALLEEKQKILGSHTGDTANETIDLLKEELAKKTILYEKQLVSEPEINELKRKILDREGKQAALQAEIERLGRIIEIDKKELAWLEATNKRNVVRAAFPATINEIPAFEGKFVDEKTPVIIMKEISGEKQVKAHLTKSEALQLRLGADVKIEIPSQNLQMKGKLVRLEEEKHFFNRELAVAVVQPERPELIKNLDEGTPVKLTITKKTLGRLF